MRCLKKTGKSLKGPWVVLLHGFGAGPEDLSSLAVSMTPSKDLNWLFPEGPVELKNSPGARGWFRIEASDLNKLKHGDPDQSASESRPPGLKKARLALLREIKALGVPWSDIVLGGFSQGAMTAMELALQMDESPRALLLFSSGVIAGPTWQSRLKRHKAIPVFQSHGQRDDVIHIAEAEKLRDLMKDSGLSVQYESFHGGHELPPEIVQRAKEFLRKTLT